MRFTKSLAVLATVISGLAFASAASAQTPNWQAQAAFGYVELWPGFAPDPYGINVVAGGDMDAGRMGCYGYVASGQPDVDIYWGGSYTMTIYATSGADTTLLVRDPYGEWWCNDDWSGVDPGMTFQGRGEGLYSIWIGTWGGTADATLWVSEY